ncbi:MAG: neuromedin U [Draconibacterium sp.]|nr:neuromedin U [Draconibacterium sp.]
MSIRLIIVLFLVCAVGVLNAQQSQEELSKAAANPLADLISLPFQNNLNINYGPYNRNVNVLNIQPVIPLFKGKFITRTIIPIVSIPDFTQESGMQSTGLGDIILTGFFVPESKGLMWGFGPVIELPTGGSIRGSQKWSVGPSLVLMAQPGDWTFGGLINNAWSFAGDSDRKDVNHMLINLFIVRQLGKGWYVNSAPIITTDWTAKPDDKWIGPIGVGGGKLLMSGGKLPLNLQTQLYYNVVRPDFGSEWQWRVQAQILLPTSMFGKK